MNQVIDNLQKQYDTAGPYFLSDFYQPGGEKRLYDFLTSVYRSAFENNFRILLVQDCADQYLYQDLPGHVISTLQKYASQIDISNFFILVITGNTNIANELEQARQLYSTDDVCIQSLVVSDMVYNVADSKKQDTFCVLPWMHLYVGPNGNVLPCCEADQQYPMGSVKEQSVDAIIKSEKFNRLRHNMLSGKRSKECSRCYHQEDIGSSSARLKNNVKWIHKLGETKQDGSVDTFKPLYLDLRLSNLCNLKCRMCSGYFSSAIAQEDLKLYGNSKYISNTMMSDQKSAVLDELIDYLPYIEKIYFAGGEPLLANEHYKILNALIEYNNTDLEIFYNTNFTSLSYKDISVIDLWKKFSNITIGASLDAHGDVAEYIRHGTKWSVIESNLQLLKSQCPHVTFTVTSTVGCLNVSSLIELQKNWHTDMILDISKFKLSTVVSPDHLTLQILPLHHKQRLSEKIQEHIIWCQQHQAMPLARDWQNVLNYMMAKDQSYFLNEFRRLTLAMDQHRQESFKSTFPEFRDLL